MSKSNDLERRILDFAACDASELDHEKALVAFRELIGLLNRGEARSAMRAADGAWQANAWVKAGILLGFRLGRLQALPSGQGSFYDKDTYPLKPLAIDNNVRVVPGGSAVRTGAYLAPGVVCMPPMYVNTGAYVDAGTMIDSHALVGSCAQIGQRVHLSAAVQIGGVLEPVGAVPVVVEDDVFIGGGCGIYEGTVIRQGAVLAPGVVLTGSTRIYDLVESRIIKPKPTLEVPEYAVVVPGARQARSAFGAAHGLSLYTPVIVKYRDARTNAATALEMALR